MGREEMPSLTHHPLLPAAGERTGLWFMIVEELVLPLTGCSLWKSGPYSLPGQYSIDVSGDVGVGKSV